MIPLPRSVLESLVRSLQHQRRGLFCLEERLRFMLMFTVMQGWIGAKPDWRASWKRMIQTTPPVIGTF